MNSLPEDPKYLILEWSIILVKSKLKKNQRFQVVVLKKTFESPLDCKEIKLVNPKGSQPWIFIGRAGAEAEVPILWPPDVKSWLIGKDPDDGKDRRQEKGTLEDEMVWQYHWLNGQEFEQTPGDGEEQGSLACCSPQGNKESDMAEWLNNKKVCHSFPCKEQASFDFIAAVTICSDLGAKENKICHCFHFFPFYLPWSNGTRWHDLNFLNVELQASFFTLLFHPQETL